MAKKKPPEVSEGFPKELVADQRPTISFCTLLPAALEARSM